MGPSNTIKIFGKIQIKIEEGNYGNFVKLVRKDGKSFLINRSAWNMLLHHVPLITQSIKSDTDYEVYLTHDKKVQVKKFCEKRYVSFHQTIPINDRVIWNKYVNFDPRQWASLCKATSKIDGLLNKNVLHVDNYYDNNYSRSVVSARDYKHKPVKDKPKAVFSFFGRASKKTKCKV